MIFLPLTHAKKNSLTRQNINLNHLGQIKVPMEKKRYTSQG